MKEDEQKPQMLRLRERNTKGDTKREESPKMEGWMDEHTK